MLEQTILYHSVSHSYLAFCKNCGLIPLEIAENLDKRKFSRLGSKHRLSKRIHIAIVRRNRESKFGILTAIIDKLGIICTVNANLETSEVIL